jgi:tetraacyldisaccharide 4'-kinase
MREPSFWWREPALAASVLAPVAAIYGAVATRRLHGRGRRADVPVICIGNPTVGGAGKTPTALAVARLLSAAGERPVFLTRGYGGSHAGPLEVDAARHRAADVGDEPLLLARAAPTIVARARVAGAQLACARGASVIVMDDGFQNPSLVKDVSLLVVDARRGQGNGKVIPAGPLRAPLDPQLALAHALVVIGSPLSASTTTVTTRARGLPVFRARLVPDASFLAALGSSRVLAFAGIGDPQKFFATLAEAGVTVAATRGFPDHHRFSQTEAKALREQADRDGLMLLTTEKDLARLAGDAELSEFAAHVHALPVTVAFEDEHAFRSLLLERVSAARTRSMAATR